MSKVAEKSAGETLAQLKDSYQQRESDMELRHRDQLRELNETHQTEVTRLRKENVDKIKTIQEENSAKMNQKDLQYQKEIEALRSMYSKKVVSEAKHASKREQESEES